MRLPRPIRRWARHNPEHLPSLYIGMIVVSAVALVLLLRAI